MPFDDYDRLPANCRIAFYHALVKRINLNTATIWLNYTRVSGYWGFETPFGNCLWQFECGISIFLWISFVHNVIIMCFNHTLIKGSCISVLRLEQAQATSTHTRIYNVYSCKLRDQITLHLNNWECSSEIDPLFGGTNFLQFIIGSVVIRTRRM